MYLPLSLRLYSFLCFNMFLTWAGFINMILTYHLLFQIHSLQTAGTIVGLASFFVAVWFKALLCLCPGGLGLLQTGCPW